MAEESSQESGWDSRPPSLSVDEAAAWVKERFTGWNVRPNKDNDNLATFELDGAVARDDTYLTDYGVLVANSSFYLEPSPVPVDIKPRTKDAVQVRSRDGLVKGTIFWSKSLESEFLLDQKSHRMLLLKYMPEMWDEAGPDEGTGDDNEEESPGDESDKGKKDESREKQEKEGEEPKKSAGGKDKNAGRKKAPQRELVSTREIFERFMEKWNSRNRRNEQPTQDGPEFPKEMLYQFSIPMWQKVEAPGFARTILSAAKGVDSREGTVRLADIPKIHLTGSLPPTQTGSMQHTPNFSTAEMWGALRDSVKDACDLVEALSSNTEPLEDPSAPLDDLRALMDEVKLLAKDGCLASIEFSNFVERSYSSYTSKVLEFVQLQGVQRVQAVRAEIRGKQEERTDLSKKIYDLNEEIKSLHKKLQDSEKREANWQARQEQLDDMDKKLYDAEVDVQQYKDAIEEKEKEIAKLNGQMSKNEQELKEYIKLYNASQSEKPASESRQEQNPKYVKENAELREKVELLQGAATDWEQTALAHQQQINELQSYLDAFRDSFMPTPGNLDTRAGCEDLYQRILRTQTNIQANLPAAMQSLLDAQDFMTRVPPEDREFFRLAQHQEEDDHFPDEGDFKTEEDLKKAHARLRKENQRLHGQLAQIRDKPVEASKATQPEDFKALRDHIVQNTKQVSQLTDKLKEKDGQLEKMHSNLKALRKEYDDYKQPEGTDVPLDERCAQLEVELRDKEAELKALEEATQQPEDFKASRTEVEQLKKERNNAEKARRKEERARVEARDGLQAVTEENRFLKQTIQDKNDHIQTLEDRMDKDKISDPYQANYPIVITDLQKEVRALKQANRKLELDQRRDASKAQALEITLTQLKTDRGIDQMTRARDTMRKQIIDLETRLKHETEAKEEAKNRATELKKEMKDPSGGNWPRLVEKGEKREAELKETIATERSERAEEKRVLETAQREASRAATARRNAELQARKKVEALEAELAIIRLEREGVLTQAATFPQREAEEEKKIANQETQLTLLQSERNGFAKQAAEHAATVNRLRAADETVAALLEGPVAALARDIEQHKEKAISDEDLETREQQNKDVIGDEIDEELRLLKDGAIDENEFKELVEAKLRGREDRARKPYHTWNNEYLDRARKMAESLQKENDRLRQNKTKFQEEVKQCRERLQKVEHELEKMRAENDGLKQLLEEEKTKTPEPVLRQIEAMNVAMDRIKEELEQASQRLAKAEEDLQKCLENKASEVIQAQLEALKDMVSSRDQELEEVRKQLSETEAALEKPKPAGDLPSDMQVHLQELQNGIASRDRDLVDVRRQLQETQEALRQQQQGGQNVDGQTDKALRDRIQGLLASAAERERERDDFRKSLEAAEAELGSKTAELAETAELRTRLETAEADLVQRTTDLAQTTLDLAQTRAELAQTRVDLDDSFGMRNMYSENVAAIQGRYNDQRAELLQTRAQRDVARELLQQERNNRDQLLGLAELAAGQLRNAQEELGRVVAGLTNANVSVGRAHEVALHFAFGGGGQELAQALRHSGGDPQVIDQAISLVMARARVIAEQLTATIEDGEAVQARWELSSQRVTNAQRLLVRVLSLWDEGEEVGGRDPRANPAGRPCGRVGRHCARLGCNGVMVCNGYGSTIHGYGRGLLSLIRRVPPRHIVKTVGNGVRNVGVSAWYGVDDIGRSWALLFSWIFLTLEFLVLSLLFGFLWVLWLPMSLWHRIRHRRNRAAAPEGPQQNQPGGGGATGPGGGPNPPAPSEDNDEPAQDRDDGQRNNEARPLGVWTLLGLIELQEPPEGRGAPRRPTAPDFPALPSTALVNILTSTVLLYAVYVIVCVDAERRMWLGSNRVQRAYAVELRDRNPNRWIPTNDYRFMSDPMVQLLADANYSAVSAQVTQWYWGRVHPLLRSLPRRRPS